MLNPLKLFYRNMQQYLRFHCSIDVQENYLVRKNEKRLLSRIFTIVDFSACNFLQKKYILCN